MDQKLVSKVLQVEGMTCTSCELRIEKELKKLIGVTEVKAHFSKSKVNVTYDINVISIDQIINTIQKLDYKVLDSVQQSKPKEKITNDNSKLIAIGIILLAGYVIIKHTVGFNFIPQVSQNMGYGILFVVGLLTSLHCIAMCGGINLSQCVSYRVAEGDTSKFSKLKPSFMYNAGRVLSYTIIGGIVGALGSVISFSGAAKGIVAIASGIFMVIMGLNMLNIFPWLRKINPRMPKIFGNKIHGSSAKHGPFYVGLINGFMPCGPLQAMQLYALGTGSFVAGALSMFFFSIGTVPLMFGFGALSSYLSRKFTRDMMQVSAILVIVLGFVLAGRGLNLSGVNMNVLAFGSSAIAGAENVATISNGVQKVTTTLESGKYTPFIVQKGIPVQWIIKVEEGDLNGCNNPVTIPKYNIEKKLVVGDNLIEFTPEEEGNITYTCWMGMIRSNIKVVEDISNISKEVLDENDKSSNDLLTGQGSGGCCTAGSKATEFANGNIPTDDIMVADIENDQQVVTITVNDYGYSPAVIVLQKGVEAKIKFNTEQLNSCNNVVVFPEYNGQLDLQVDEQKETPWLVPEQDFTFQCWMGMLNGYVKVVDDLDAINLEEIKKEVGNYQPVGGGGCCGK